MNANEVEKIKTPSELVPEDIGATVRIMQARGSMTGVLEEFCYSSTVRRNYPIEPTESVVSSLFYSIRLGMNDSGMSHPISLKDDAEIHFLKLVDA